MPTEELEAYLVATLGQIRLSPRPTAFTTARMEQFLRRLGVSVAAYLRWSGEKTLSDFRKATPLWSLRAWQVLLIENLEVVKRS